MSVAVASIVVPFRMAMTMPVPSSIASSTSATPVPTASASTATVPATSRWIRISRRIGRVERESDHHIVRSCLRGASDDQLGASRRTQADRNRGSPIGIGDRGVGVQLPIRHPGVEPKHDARSRNQAPTGIGRLDYQWRGQGTADRAALSVTGDRAQLGRQLIPGKGHIAAAGREEEGSDRRERSGKRTRSKTRSSHTSPC